MAKINNLIVEAFIEVNGEISTFSLETPEAMNGKILQLQLEAMNATKHDGIERKVGFLVKKDDSHKWN